MSWLTARLIGLLFGLHYIMADMTAFLARLAVPSVLALAVFGAYSILRGC